MFFNSSTKYSLKMIDNSCECCILNVNNFRYNNWIAEASSILHLIISQGDNFGSCRWSSFEPLDAGHRILGKGKVTCTTTMNERKRSGNFDCNFFIPDSLGQGIFSGGRKSFEMIVIWTLTNDNVHEFKFNIVE